MKIFPVFIKKFFGGGGQGLTLSTGTETESMGQQFSTTLAHGTDAQVMAMALATSIAHGAQTEAVNVRPDASIVAPQGSESESVNHQFQTSLAHGSEGEQDGISAVATITDTVNTATNTRNSGSTDWANPTNAQGAFNGTEATFTLASGVVLTAGDATLKCSGLIGAGVLPGFTRVGAQIQIRHRWDLVVGALDVVVAETASTVAELRDAAGTTVLATLVNRDQASVDRNQATLITETFDIHGVVTDAQLAAGVQVWCRAAASLPLVASGNMSWAVDGINLNTIYQIRNNNLLTVNDVTANENAGTATLTVTRSSPFGTCSVNYATSNRSTAVSGDDAIVGEDYTATAGTLNFAAGETTKPIVVPLVDNNYAEPNRRVAVNLTGAVNAQATDPTGLVVIADNEAAKTYLQDFSANGKNLTELSASTDEACPIAKFGRGRRYGTNNNNNGLRRANDPSFVLTGSAAATFVFAVNAAPGANETNRLLLCADSNNGTVTSFQIGAGTGASGYFGHSLGGIYTSYSLGTLSLGYHTITVRRDDTAKTLVVKLDGVTVVDVTYSGAVTQSGGGGQPELRLNSYFTTGQSLAQSSLYDVRLWNTAKAQAALDAIVAAAGKCKPEGDELVFYRLQNTPA